LRAVPDEEDRDGEREDGDAGLREVLGARSDDATALPEQRVDGSADADGSPQQNAADGPSLCLDDPLVHLGAEGRREADSCDQGDKREQHG